jgi:hypothetical protein
MKVKVKALVPALALAAALSLPSVAEAGHRHGPRCGHRGHYSHGYRSDGYSRGRGYGYSDGYSRGSRHGYYSDGYYSDRYRSDGYSRGSRHGYYSQPYGYSHWYQGHRPRYNGHGYAPYGYDDGYGYDPPPRYRSRRPRVGVSLYFGF